MSPKADICKAKGDITYVSHLSVVSTNILPLNPVARWLLCLLCTHKIA